MARFSFRFIDNDWDLNEPSTEIIHKFDASKNVETLLKHFENFLKSSGVEINGSIYYIQNINPYNPPDVKVDALDEIKIDTSNWNDYNLSGNTIIEIDPQYSFDNMMAAPPSNFNDDKITIKGIDEEPLHFRL